MSRMVGGANSECQLRRERLDVLRDPALVNDPEPDEDGHQPGGDECPDGCDTGDRADCRPCVGRQQEPAECLALEQRVAGVGDAISGGLECGDLSRRLTNRSGDCRFGRCLGRSEVGVRRPRGDLGKVAIDVAGVGLCSITGWPVADPRATAGPAALR